MVRVIVLLTTVLVGSISATQAIAQQTGFILFYRPDTSTDRGSDPTVYFIKGDTTRLATISKGEFFALELTEGTYTFSWTRAPARGQKLVVNLHAGEQVFARIRPENFIQTGLGEAPLDIEGVRPIDRLRVYEGYVLIPSKRLEFKEPEQPGNEAIARNDAPTSPEPQPSGPSIANREPIRQPVSPPLAPPQPNGTRSGRVKELKIHGYVTAVNGGTFEIEDYRITRDAGFILDFENQGPDVLAFKMEDVRVGTELEIRGLYDQTTGELKATRGKIDLEQFRKQKSTAVLSRPPAGLTKYSEGWAGTFLVNGQRVRVTPQTSVVFKLTNAEKKVAKAAEKGKATEDDLAEFRPLDSLEEITPGMVMKYEGMREIETGMIFADKVEFSKNQFEAGEQDLWKQCQIKVNPSNLLTLQPGELSGPVFGKKKLVPSEEVQEYVTRIGETLLPRYLSEIPNSDPGKLNFRFFVVIDKAPNALAAPNGVFLVHSGLFDVVENEAQLAAIIGHEIAHAVHEHTWRRMQNKKALKLGLQIGQAIAVAFGQYQIANIATMTHNAVETSFQRSMENQADRMGLEYMVNAGYDPREAPRVWKVFAKALGDEALDPFTDSHDTKAARRSYLMNELRNNYSDLDYSALRTNEGEYQRIAKLVKETASGTLRIKVR